MQARQALNAKDKRDWVRLARCEGIGPVTFFGLVSRFGTPRAALSALPDLLKQGRGKAIGLISNDQAEDEIAATAARGATILAACEPGFPKGLAALTPPPPIISVCGQLELLQKNMVGIVGARNASAAGLRLAREFAGGLGRAGYVIASGLARGIDGAAHSASLATGTIGVLAGGLDHIYPPEHESLYHQIREEGVLVSESPLFAKVHARDFPRRNRIISGLSLGTLIVEAEARSGSLITARFAAEQGREVMAVPGSPLDPRAAGPNSLIRDGAHLVTCVDDILECLGSVKGFQEEKNLPYLHDTSGVSISPEALDRVAALLSPVPMSLADLAADTGLPWRTIAAIVVELELSGRAVTQVGGLVSSPV
jgi:DNA processing protein